MTRSITATGLAIALSLVAIAMGTAACGGGERPARVVLISIDTLRADHLGAYGADWARTPVLDGVAASGVRFETAISPAPLTLVSHTTLLTGLDPPEHGVRHNGIFRLDRDVPTLATALHEAGFATGAFVGAFVLDRRFGLERGFDHYDDRVERPSTGGNLAGFAERTADQVVDAALAWLDTAPDAFFLWVHVYDPHAEYRPPPGFAAAFPGRPYDGEIAFTDRQMGRLLDAVRARWPDGRTLVVITSDHGDSLGEHGESTHSHFVYDATQHIPLLMSGPGLPAGRVVPDVVALRDVAPTILDLLGLAPLDGASGRSLAPLVRGRRLEPRAAYVETLSVQFDWGWSPLLGLRTADRKYVRAPRPELYDLAADPGERVDLAAERPDEVAALDARLEERLASARPVAPNLDLDAGDRARLEALGYLADAGAAPSRALGEVGGLDPKDEIATVETINRADRLMTEERHEEALDLLRPLARPSLVIQTLLSRAYLGVGDAVRAEAAARAAIEASPSNPAGRQQLAEVLLAQDRLDEVRGLLEERLAGEGPNGKLLLSLGRLEQAEGHDARASELFAGALEAPDPAPEAALELAALELEAGREDEAEAFLGGAAPGAAAAYPPAARRVVRALALRGRTDEALARARRLAEDDPSDGETRLLLADLLARTGEPQEARRLRESVVDGVGQRLRAGSDRAGSPFLLYLRARAAADLGRTDLARASLARALEREVALDWEARRQARALARRLGLSRRDAAAGTGG